jgi:predicted phage-related endonuclease
MANAKRTSSLTDEELRARVGKITSSTAHAIVTGEGQHEAYRRIMAVEEDPFKDGLPDNMLLGVLLEDGIRQFASQKLDLEFEKPTTVIHKEYPFIADSADGVAAVEGEQFKKAATLECKLHGSVVAKEFGQPGTDAVPERTYIQAQWHNMVWDTPVCYVVPVLAGFVMEAPIYPVKRDPDLEEAMIFKAKNFYEQHIVTGVEPELDGLDSTVEYIKNRYKEVLPGKEVIQAEGKVSDWVDQLLGLKAAIKKMEQDKKSIENRIKEVIGDRYGVQGPGWRATWGEVKGRAKTDWESLAKELGASRSDIEKYTSIGAGYRRFVVNEVKK